MQFQKITPPQKGLEFPEGLGLIKDSFHGGGMDTCISGPTQFGFREERDVSTYSHHKYCLATTHDEFPQACVFTVKLLGMSQQYCLRFYMNMLVTIILQSEGQYKI